MNIVVAFIENNQGQLLITKRASDTIYGGYWELPGGKVEIEESPFQAIQREIVEELNLNVVEIDWLDDFKDEIHFSLFHVKKITGELKLNAGQSQYRWVFTKELKDYKFPNRNQHFFKIWRSLKSN